MKRKSLLFLLLLAFMAPWAAQAYNHQVQVGNGTSSSYYAPINLYYNYSYVQMIYTAEQINGSCALPGNIESISFYYAGTVEKTAPITVFMKTTNNDAFSSATAWETVTEDDIVFDGDWTVSPSGWMTITFPEAFPYDGESNLLIAIDKGYYSNYSSSTAFRYTATTNNQVLRVASDGTNYNPYTITSSGSTMKNLPNILFNMTLAHPAPSALTVDEVAIETATISWTAPQTTNTITGYAYNYTDGETVVNGTTTTTTANLTGLTGGTDYIFEVKTIFSNGESCWSEALDFTTMEACMTPENLQITNVTAHGATLNWTEGYGDGQWVLKYKLSTEEEYTNSVNVALADLPYTLTGLTPEKTYNVQIAPVCDVTKTLTGNFTTAIACPAPTGFAASNITAHAATLNWTGTSNSYTVSYRTKAYINGIEEGFGTAPSGWIFRTGALNADGTATLTGTSSWTRSTSNGVFDTHIYMNMYSTKNYWLITPSMDINNGDALSFDIAYTAYIGTQAAPAPNCTTHRFAVLISTDNMATWTILREWNNNTTGTDVLDNVSQSGENVSISLANYVGQTVYVAFFGHSETSSYDNNFHFDNVAIGTPVAAGEWQTITTEEAPAQLTGLVAETEYEAKLVGDCDDEGLSAEVGPITFTTDVACLAPTGFQIVENSVKADQVTLSWTSGADAWQIQVNDNTDLVNVEEGDVTINEGVVTYILTDLTPETPYTVKLRANCGDEGYSAWTSPLSFTTLSECPTPTNVAVTNIEHYSATVTWVGNSEDGFTVKYRTAPTWNLDGINEGFEDGMPSGWTQSGPGTWNVNAGYGYNNISAHSGTYNIRINHLTTNNETFLITPMLDLSGQSNVTMNFWYVNYDWTGDIDQLYVYYRINEGEWTELWNTTEAHQEWTTSGDIILPNPSANYQIGFKMVDKYGHGVGLDDIVIGNPTQNPAGEWMTVAAEDSPADIDDLDIETKYEVVVVPNCGEESASEPVFFTTKSANQKVFAIEGDWGTASNWVPTGVPTFDQTVELHANTTITGEAFAKTITQGNYTITIENGGKLKSNTGVTATVKKTIRGYETNYDAENYNNGDYYLITNPLTSSHTLKTDGTDGFMVGNYDLYRWNYLQDLEWIKDVTSLSSGATGYLYANETGTTLIYTGTINGYTSYKYANASVSSSPDSYDFPGWYLLGNPYMYDAYLAGASINGNALPYIKMNVDGDGFENVAAGTPIAPMEGFFYQGVTGATSAYVVTYVPTVQNNGKLNMNLRKGNKQLDNAILVFGGDQQLGKMSFRENSSKIYMPVDGKNYAIVSTESMGEMPVSFKAENNGSYTLSFNAEEVSFAYLHLIDNMTGANVDLLQTPSYSFEASTTDYADRFKLVFATGENGNSDTFAFFSNGSFVINNEGNATVQVIDITGRIINSETINGCANVNVNAAPGVYMLRLINGDNVKVQKVVVR